jgi:hypothetical protein
MIKNITKIALLTFVGMTSTAVNAQVEEGNVIIDTYYGFPNLYTAVFKTAYANSGTELDLKVSGLGPVGIRGEYLVSDKFGIGLDIHYQQSVADYNQASNSSNNPVIYNYNFKTTKIAIMPSFNFHFLEEDAMDLYMQLAAGYGNREFKFTSTEPGYTMPVIKGLVPVAFRIAVGYRYFFTENLGINMAVGLGGPLVSGGLSLKF